MDATILGIGLGIGGAAVTVGAVFLEITGMLKARWLQGGLGLTSVTLFAAALWVPFPHWWLPIVGAATIAVVGVLAVVSQQVREVLKGVGEGWQLPFRSPRKSKPSTLRIYPEVDGGTNPVSTWLEQLADEQRSKLYAFVKTLSHNWIWQGLDTDDPYIETIRELFNGSVFELRLTGIEGELTVNKSKCQDSARLSPSNFPSGHSAHIRITQPIRGQIMLEKLKQARGQKTSVEIGFGPCVYIFSVVDPDSKISRLTVSVGTWENPTAT